MVTILSYSERADLQLELASLANELISKLGGGVSVSALIGYNVKGNADMLSKYFDKVFIIDSENLKLFDLSNYVSALMEVVNKVKPDIILVSGNRRGGAVASALSAVLDVGCVTEVVKVEVVNNDVITYRSAYGGLGQARTRVLTTPKIIAVKPGAYQRSTVTKNGTVEELKVDLKKSEIELVDMKPKEAGVKLNEADIVVVAGRGVKKREDLQMLDELAKILGGVLGCSRPLSADLGWFPNWVGMSGVTIKPRLYIGIGVSGQIQHVAGIRDSKIIVAINIDPNAPIFEYVDYGIVGDLYKVVPKLIDELKKIRQ
ncbi:MAG: electron transfer flavoprotein subunit alpha/FixB family protein [Vulcanisaeta sp.]